VIEVVWATPLYAAVWEHSLGVRPWDGEPVWIHGDLLESNLLVRDGRLYVALTLAELASAIPLWMTFPRGPS